jgi:hypothetical protein
MEKKMTSVRNLATLVAAIAAVAALAPLAGPMFGGETSVPAPKPAAGHIFVPTAVAIPEREADPAPTF